MVTAGVFLVARSEPLLVVVPGVLVVIARVGAFTALLAATMACVESDIKRVLAYSTVSQLGYMMAAAGAGATDAGFFHLLTHGIFKALLFLGAGAVIHAVGTNDIFRMGGLWRAMPQTGLVFIVGTLALAGVWPLAGFFSKEAVLAGVGGGGQPITFLTLAFTAFLTAFYMFRVVFVAFFGRAHAHGEVHPHDPPWLMRGPLWLLAALTVGIGLRFAVGGADEHHPPAWLTALSLALAAGGLLLAWAMYGARWLPVDVVRRPLAAIEFLARRRYFLDAIYGGLYRGFILGFARLIGWIDRYLVDGCLNVASAWSLRAGDALRRIQSGQPQDYVYGVAFGVLLLMAWAQWWRSP
jgi:NADH-quinone oxidoreductase subunit L